MALVAAFKSGVKQRDLAVQYGISIRSVKRLVRAARDAGAIKIPSPT
jgi:DNA-binding transcriptional regulator LsrR (DeoR family)